MKTIKCNLLIIGAGPAGLAAAIEADRLGIRDILLLERNDELGGILQQCIHDGFGLQRFKEQLSGPAYAQRFIDEIKQSNVEIKLRTMVIELHQDKSCYAINSEDGVLEIHPQAVILAMGCRERTRNQVFILGDRPGGIMTAGTLQRYMNIEGLIPGRKAVILGSGDIGMIMARRMKLEGIEVEGVYEIMPRPGGLQRNVFQCLQDFDIPLHLSTSVKSAHGKSHLEGVTVVAVDENLKQIAGTERYIACDLLVLSVGLIPENELSEMAQIPISEVTKGPLVDNNLMTQVDGIFAAGNVTSVFDLVDYVSASGETAARGAANYIREEKQSATSIDVLAGKNVTSLIPMKYKKDGQALELYFRSKSIIRAASVHVMQQGQEIYKRKFQIVRPEEMIKLQLKADLVAAINPRQAITVEIRENGRVSDE